MQAWSPAADTARGIRSCIGRVEMAGFNKSQFSKRTGNHLVMTWWICVFGFVV